MKTKTHLLIRILLLSVIPLVAFLAGCDQVTPTESPPSTTNEPPGVVETLVPEEPQGETTTEEALIITPTPAPTATPGPLNDLITEIAYATGLNRRSLLGLTGEDWINLIISILIVFLGITLLGRLLYSILLRIARSTPVKYDDIILSAIQRQLLWLLYILTIQWSTNRLIFLPASIKSILNLHYFTLYALVITAIVWKLIDLGLEWYQDQSSQHSHRPNPFIPLLRRTSRIAIIMISTTIIMQNYGINISALIAVLGIGGLAFSLGAQDTLADAISGFIILMDQPFREGDRIEIQELGTWGDVVEIGTRTTRIRTLDNRMVIVPNSVISKNQIVNYTFPDPRYRVQIEIGVEYGVKLPLVRKIITETIRGVDGVILEKPVDVLFLEFGDPALILRVRWWINSYLDTRRMFDKVNEAIYDALNEAKIDLPPKMYDVRILRESPDIQDPNANDLTILD